MVDLIEHDFGVDLHLSESSCPTAPAPESTPQQEEQKDEPKEVSSAGGKELNERDLVETLIALHGPPFYAGDNGRPGILNEPFFAGLYAAENHVLFVIESLSIYFS